MSAGPALPGPEMLLPTFRPITERNQCRRCIDQAPGAGPPRVTGAGVTLATGRVRHARAAARFRWVRRPPPRPSQRADGYTCDTQIAPSLFCANIHQVLGHPARILHGQRRLDVSRRPGALRILSTVMARRVSVAARGMPAQTGGSSGSSWRMAHCAYDQVRPGTNPDGTAEGPRSPLDTVSPFAKPGFTGTSAASCAGILSLPSTIAACRRWGRTMTRRIRSSALSISTRHRYGPFT